MTEQSTKEHDSAVAMAKMPSHKKIRMARVEAGLTQPKLAELTGIAQGNLSNIETGKVKATTDTVDRIRSAIADYMGHDAAVFSAADGVLGIVGRTQGKLALVDIMAEPRPVEWLVEGFLARRFVTMIAGQEGAGKSAVCQTIAVALASGAKSAMGMALPGHQHRGLVLDAENVMVLGDEGVDGSLAQGRFQAFGLTDEHAPNVTIAGADGFDLDKDYDALDAVLQDMADDGVPASFLVLDSWTSLWFGNENVVDDVRRVLTKLNRLAVRHNIGVLLIHHTNKAGDAYRGTSAIGATIAAVFTFSRLVWKDPETGKKTQHPTGRFLASYKVRMAAEPKPRLVHITGGGVVAAGDEHGLDNWDVEEEE